MHRWEKGTLGPDIAGPKHQQKETMYTPIVGSGMLASTGVAAATQNLWIALAAVVIGGAAIAVSRFGPRIALDPIRQESGGYRIRLTKNGQPWSRKRHH